VSLKASYSFIAPVYDAIVEAPLRRARARSLRALPAEPGIRVLINGIGTGLDIPYLRSQQHYVGSDLTRAMLRKAAQRKGDRSLALVQANSLALPFRDASFDYAILHLIVAVVSDPVSCLEETARVLKPGGTVLVLDKFLRVGQLAPLRRVLNPLARRIATRLDVVWEEVLTQVPGLQVMSDEPAVALGWFRAIRLKKV